MSQSPKLFRFLAVASVCAMGLLTVLPAPAAAADGKALFAKHCQACHQAGGKGLSGVFPPLAGNPNLVDQPQRIIDAVLKGKSGALEVNGVTYNGFMPPMNYLSNDDVAAIANYINLNLAGGQEKTDAGAVASLR